MSPFKNTSINVIILGATKSFIDSLNNEEKQMAFAMIKELGKLPHSPKLVKLIDSKKRIYEARGATKDFWVRMFWFYHKPRNQDSVIVVTNGYLKKDNKTDPNETKKATNIKRSYEA